MAADVLIPRQQQPHAERLLDSFRVVVIHGPRQCGKSTLARLIADARGGTFAPLDDEATFEAAMSDPTTFVNEQRFPLVIDEVQLGGDRIVRAVKRSVDATQQTGRYLLTGSTNFLTVPTISESLAGRAAIVQLWPLSQAEMSAAAVAGGRASHDGGMGPSSPDTMDRGTADVMSSWPGAGVIHNWFDGAPDLGHQSTTERADYLELICRGGFPEALRLDPASRGVWFRSYAETVIRRDVVALGDIRRAAALPRLLALAAASTSGVVNIANWSRLLGIDRATVESYLEWMRRVFLIHELPSWGRDRIGQVVRRARLHVTDSGLAAALCGTDPAALRPLTSTMTGALTETFVVNEIARLLSASDIATDIQHYRNKDGKEVDIVLERPDGATVAIEVKASASPRRRDLGHVGWLRDRLDGVAPGAFRCGLLLHTGTAAHRIGDRLYWMPIDSLWSHRS
ncbi:ATP-binding protein [Candidatus Poriferisodalis sp.]|uniref:ATP-binding protein n=1 Tax=Candidatus Poriferisodalis sp. TaxID=3101277 RepID=UPI003B01C494